MTHALHYAFGVAPDSSFSRFLFCSFRRSRSIALCFSAARPIRHQHSRDSDPASFPPPGSRASRIECACRAARTKL